MALPMKFPQYTAFSRPQWTRLPTKEPLSSDAKAEVKTDLRNYFTSYRRDGSFRMEAKFSWTSERMALTLNHSRPTKNLDPKQLKSICNKPTLLYWAFSAQRDDRCPLLPFGCIYKEWFRYHNNKPDIEFGHFFANPIRMTSTGPATIGGILEAHQALCDQVSTLLHNISRGKARELLMGSWPNTEHYRMLPLCRAIVVVLDQFEEDTEEEADGSISVDKASLRQTILMVSTGDDSGLSAPISFESIKAQTLPLARSDVPSISSINMVRVPLTTAVQFVADLERREEAAFPDSRHHSAMDSSLSPRKDGDTETFAFGADMWVDKIMQEAEEKGIDGVFETWESVRRVEARKRGEKFGEFGPYHFHAKWK
ncbi:hypothetical protein OEA41_010408 [Lepraria neglecta]|uniref:Uncharacterized protein n=1 Tax=Lepraria neglecta TaxID=209136 RepID=A0AAD9YWK3_9LECA|nr:hypothetical protein OEA41_010408 [Lepraria neglecta]